SPDSRRLLSTGSAAQPARIWDVATGRAILLKDACDVGQVAFSPDSARVFTVGVGDQVGRLWDASTGFPLKGQLKHDGPVVHGAFHPKGHSVATVARDGVRLWEVGGGQRVFLPLPYIRNQAGDARVWPAHFSPDGR